MHETSQAYDLTTLARRLIRERLLRGPDLSLAVRSLTDDPRVRLWDPAADWQVGDHVIVARNLEGGLKPFVGQVVALGTDTVTMRLDGCINLVSYEKAVAGSEKARTWHLAVRAAIEGLRDTADLDEQVERILLERGESIVSRLLGALQADGRFISLCGRWFLRDLLQPVPEADLKGIHKQLRATMASPSTEEILTWLPAVELPEDVRLFSLYEALLAHPELFRNVGDATQPRWAAVPFVPEWNEARTTCYAYDPETYEILIEPGQRLTKGLAMRLQQLGLYEKVVTFDD